MSEGQSQRLVASSAQHRQEAEVAAAEERERATARAARLAMAELSAARAKVEAAATADAARAAAAELEALRGSSTSSSVSADGGTDDELKQAREVAREQAAVGNRATPGARWWLPRRARTRRRLGRWITAFTGGAALPPRTCTMVIAGSKLLSETSVPALGGLPSPRPTTSSGPW
jgi:hypothetical protein